MKRRPHNEAGGAAPIHLSAKMSFTYKPLVGKEARFVLLFERRNSYGKIGSEEGTRLRLPGIHNRHLNGCEMADIP